MSDEKLRKALEEIAHTTRDATDLYEASESIIAMQQIAMDALKPEPDWSKARFGDEVTECLNQIKTVRQGRFICHEYNQVFFYMESSNVIVQTEKELCTFTQQRYTDLVKNDWPEDDQFRG